MDNLCPILCVYENVKGATERSADDDGNMRRPAIETVVEDSLSNGYNTVPRL